jgi:hypothetical protein
VAGEDTCHGKGINKLPEKDNVPWNYSWMMLLHLILRTLLFVVVFFVYLLAKYKVRYNSLPSGQKKIIRDQSAEKWDRLKYSESKNNCIQ